MKQRILIVDDEPEILDLLDACLSGDYTVFRAENGKVAETLFRQVQPHLIVTDIMMPERDGIEMVRSIRKKAPGTKIIAMSAGKNHIYLEASSALGADRVVTKPFRLHDLHRAVDELLENSEPA